MFSLISTIASILVCAAVSIGICKYRERIAREEGYAQAEKKYAYKFAQKEREAEEVCRKAEESCRKAEESRRKSEALRNWIRREYIYGRRAYGLCA